MKDILLEKFWALLFLARNALICEYYTIARNEPGVSQFCGDCIQCWLMRKVLIVGIIVFTWLFSPTLSVAIAIAYGVALSWEQIMDLLKALLNK